MDDYFSFDTAEELIQLLSNSNIVLENNSNRLMNVYKQLRSVFRDGGYLALMESMNNAYKANREVRNQMRIIIASIARYKEQLYQLYVEGLISKIDFDPIHYETTVRFGSAGEGVERKNRQLEFQNEVKAKIRDKNIPNAVKEAYALIGARCIVASNTHKGTAFYSPSSGSIKFDLQSDLRNPCGLLSTYFHEIGHMIDFQAKPGTCLSEDKTFRDALRSDCEKYIAYIEQRYACTREDAYYHISKELMSDNNLYADVSDIMGGLTQCKCQNLWGHSLSYWEYDSERVNREAFANMYSVALGSQERVDAMKKYFPTAYARFERLLEDKNDSD